MKLPEFKPVEENKKYYDKLFLRKENVAYTHNGIFHGDDVCCGALLKMIFPDIEIRRVETLPPDAELAFDIGGGKYDHHGPDPITRPNKVAYSSFGLLWPDLGSMIIPSQFVTEFDRTIVSWIDYSDSTGKPNPLSSTLKTFNPYWNSKKTQDECYNNAVEFMCTVFDTHFRYYRNRQEGYDQIESMMEDPTYRYNKYTLMLPTYIPYKYTVLRTDICYVVYPNSRIEGSYTIALAKSLNKRQREAGMLSSRKQKFPPQWFTDSPTGCLFISPDLMVMDSMASVKYALTKLEEYITE